MPKKIFRNWIPKIQHLMHGKGIRWLAPLFRDPNLLHINKYSISLSFFIGIFCAFLPMPGQTIVATLLALWWRSNLPVAMALIWISNPLTIPPIFYATYEFGVFLLGTERVPFEIELSLGWFFNEMGQIWWPLITGSLICGLVFGGLGFWSIRLLWRWHVLRNWEKRKQKRLKQ